MQQHGQDLKAEEVWRAWLKREQQEQSLREQQRQRMARLQPNNAAYDAALTKLEARAEKNHSTLDGEERATPKSTTTGNAPDLYATALRALKRGSVNPATLITGINSDLPGRITAQVSQNVYDSATGYRLLIPQGTKLFGRYDSKVSFGRKRVLVVWTDFSSPRRPSA